MSINALNLLNVAQIQENKVSLSNIEVDNTFQNLLDDITLLSEISAGTDDITLLSEISADTDDISDVLEISKDNDEDVSLIHEEYEDTNTDLLNPIEVNENIVFNQGSAGVIINTKSTAENTDTALDEIGITDKNISNIHLNKDQIVKSGKEFSDDVKYIVGEEYLLSENDFSEGYLLSENDFSEEYLLSENDFSEEYLLSENDFSEEYLLSEIDFSNDNNIISDNHETKIIKNSISKQFEDHDNQHQEEFVEGDIQDFHMLETTETTLEEEISGLVEDKAQASNILEQFKEGIQSTSTPKHIQIILKPRSLGTLNVNIKFINQSMHVDIYVDSDEIQKVLSANLSEVEYLLNPDNSLNIDNINILKKQDKIIKENYDYKKQLFKKETQENRILRTKPIFLM